MTEQLHLGVKRDDPFESNFAKVMVAASRVGPQRVFERLDEMKGFRWVRHRRLHESCDCFACQLERGLFIEVYARA